MANGPEMTKAKLSSALEASLSNASAIITRDFLGKLESYDIITPSQEDIDIDIADCGRFYRLTKLVMNSEENFLNKLTTVVNVASSIDCSLATVIKSDGLAVSFYFGIVSKKVRENKTSSELRRKADAAAFRGALNGNLAGSELTELTREEVSRFRSEVLMNGGNCYSSVSGVVALRDEDDKSVDGYVQGIENLVDSLKGQKYTIVMLADPISPAELRTIRQGYEILYTQLSVFAGSTVTVNESDTLTMSKSYTDGISEGISKGISLTQSKTRSQSTSFGINASAGVSFIVQANVGFNAGYTSGTADMQGKTDVSMKQEQRSRSVTDTGSSAKTEGTSLQLSHENRSAKALMEKIDRYLERLDECESFGAFDCAAYIIAEDRETALAAAGNYSALMRGKDSGIQASHINSWYKPEETKTIGKYIGSLVHPRFWQDKKAGVIVTPASVVSGEELAIQVGLPKKSVTGVTVIPMAPFGRNVSENGEHSIALGDLYHMGSDDTDSGTPKKVSVDIKSLSMHTFITGSTGAGKSTAIYSILDKLKASNVEGTDDNITFLVIEPAKGEYKHRFGSYPDVKVYGTNYRKTPLLRIDPFSFPEDIHVLEHIDRLTEIFNVCWPMYAAMPAVLKDAMENSYTAAGWDLETSECEYKDAMGRPMFPSFADVLIQVDRVMESSAYSAESKSNYKGALCTRLRSLTNGLYGQIFTSEELSALELFDSNVVIDLSRTGSVETKALIMGLLVMKLQEHRMSSADGANSPLKHVTVLEEAHNILKRTSTEQSSEGANLLGKSVEMLANSIAEMRTYGEGFIIADQAPQLMDMSVIRNTNTKIILRLPDLSDRELVGRAANLNDDQILELSRLKTFVAAVYQNDWLEPVLCRIDTNFKENEKLPQYSYKQEDTVKSVKRKLIEFLVTPDEKRERLDGEYVSELIKQYCSLPVPVEAKRAFIRYAECFGDSEVLELRSTIAYYLFNSEDALDKAKGKEKNIEQWCDCVKNAIRPDISFLSEKKQNAIVMCIRYQKTKTTGPDPFTEKLLKFI